MGTYMYTYMCMYVYVFRYIYIHVPNEQALQIILKKIIA